MSSKCFLGRWSARTLPPRLSHRSTRARAFCCALVTLFALSRSDSVQAVSVPKRTPKLHSREEVSQFPIECDGFSAGRPRTFVGHNGTIFTLSRTRAGCKTSRTVCVRWPPVPLHIPYAYWLHRVVDPLIEKIGMESNKHAKKEATEYCGRLLLAIEFDGGPFPSGPCSCACSRTACVTCAISPASRWPAPSRPQAEACVRC